MFYHSLIAHFFSFVNNSYCLDVPIFLQIHLLKNILISSKFQQLWVRLLLTSVGRVLCGHKFQHLWGNIKKHNCWIVLQIPSEQELGHEGQFVRSGIIRGSYTKTLKNGKSLGVETWKVNSSLVCVLRKFSRISWNYMTLKVGLILVLWSCPSSGPPEIFQQGINLGIFLKDEHRGCLDTENANSG